MRILDPVSIPADVPSLDEHAADPIRRGEIDVAFGIRGGGAVPRTRMPAHVPQAVLKIPEFAGRSAADVHPPPDTNEFHRLDPAYVWKDVRWIEVEAQDRRREIGGSIGDLNRAPWSHERRVTTHLVSVLPRRERDAQETALHPRPGD